MENAAGSQEGELALHALQKHLEGYALKNNISRIEATPFSKERRLFREWGFESRGGLVFKKLGKFFFRKAASKLKPGFGK